MNSLRLPLPLETSYWDPNPAHGIRHLGTGPRYNTNTATAAVTSSNCTSRRHDIQSSATGAEPLGTCSSSTSRNNTLGLFDIDEGPATVTDHPGLIDINEGPTSFREYPTESAPRNG